MHLGWISSSPAGNSMGGALSLRLAALAPARVKGVFLANAASLGPDVFPVFQNDDCCRCSAKS
jgi:pimeloyl-ACP methyl ester carboxylesterase